MFDKEITDKSIEEMYPEIKDCRNKCKYSKELENIIVAQQTVIGMMEDEENVTNVIIAVVGLLAGFVIGMII